MYYTFFLLFTMIMLFLLSNNTLWCLLILILSIMIYVISMFMLNKTLVSFICFLTYISGVLILLTYMVVMSSSSENTHKKSFWFFIYLSSFLLMKDTPLMETFQNPEVDLLNKSLFQLIFIVLVLLLVQCFLYTTILNIKSLRIVL